MAHLLLLEVPGANDFNILEETVHLGHEVTFFTADLSAYLAHETLATSRLSLARDIVSLTSFDYDAFETAALAIHEKTPFDAILCLIDIRMIEAARLAARLGLKFLNCKTAKLVRDKYSVRERLAQHAIRQPRFALATTNAELKTAVETIAFPVLIKPSDGYGSQNILTFTSEAEFAALAAPFANYLPLKTDYGLGVHANDRLVVEEFIRGEVIGCETITVDGKHIFLGINDKVFFPPPCFGIKGSCFPSGRFDTEQIRDYVFQILDALNFNFGVAHTEIIITPEGPYLVEVNPRLIGAHIPRLLGFALERSIYADVINLHLGCDLSQLQGLEAHQVAVSRWITSSQNGILNAVVTPKTDDPRIMAVHVFKKPGDRVRPPFDNADRLGYVMVVGKTQFEAERLAEDFVNNTQVLLESAVAAVV
ncbi:MAG: ATP-grasp domain-containing protein [Proteobacteria bacterium]|nr:ATP-grasp domain-containing protein [Pseudomonadota bacterium]